MGRHREQRRARVDPDAAAEVALVEVESMAYGPHAVARHEGLVLFVRGAAPGERVEVRIRERRRNHAFADVIRVARRSDQRVHPACPIVDCCGGCPWQHLSYESQLAAKRQIVADHLLRIAGISCDPPPVLPSPRVYGYRRRLKLRTDGRRLGFYAGGTHDLVDVFHCALAESAIDAALADARRLTEALSGRLRRLEIVATNPSPAATTPKPAAGATDGAEAEPPTWVAAGEIEGEWRQADEVHCRRWLERTPRCAGLSLRGRRWERRWGEVEVAVHPRPHLDLRADATAFSQVNPTANRVLVEVVLRMLGEVEGMSVLEAYAGAGNFSAALAERGAVVTAVEQSAAACRSAVRNAAAYDGRWRVEQGRVEAIFERHAAAAKMTRFDVVLLDPPRSGAVSILPAILRLQPPEIIYVSCDPATLARDLATLGSRYRLTDLQSIDMFPHTYHVETVARCTLR